MILLISPECSLCQKVLEILKNQSISGLKIYDIHKISKIPPGITHVPSLITEDKKVLKGGEVINVKSKGSFKLVSSELIVQFTLPLNKTFN